jgi:solute carrier family 9B (sodium/hydrogen exchanger), member 1/2
MNNFYSYRDMALVNIMLLAGCGLDIVALKEHFGTVMRLSIIPTIIEVGSITFLSNLLLGMPIMWGVITGLVVTAISPNVVISVLLKLKEEGIGLYKGIHTVIIAVTSVNDILAIFFFGVLCGIIFTSGDLSQKIIQGPAGIVIGCVFGMVSGLMVLFLPGKTSKYSRELRYILLVFCGTLSVVGSKYIDYPSAGALGCLTASTTLAVGIKKRKLKDSSYNSDQVESYLNLMWKFLKPTSFSLVGKEVNFDILTKELIIMGIIIIIVSVGFRLLSGYMSFCSANFNWKEKGYITISSFAKATVQAAIGPYALDLVRSQENPDETQLDLAQKVLVISVLSIILTAPLGAFLMIKLSTKWLKRERSH